MLHSYGERYVGRVDPNFQHWQFVSGSPEEVRKAADFFGLSYNQKQGQIVHTLQTVLIGAGRKDRESVRRQSMEAGRGGGGLCRCGRSDGKRRHSVDDAGSLPTRYQGV